MFNSIFWAVLSYFHLIQGFVTLPKDILAATEVFGAVSSQILPSGNDTKFQEFADIFNRYVNLTLLEKDNREVVSRLTTGNSTGDNDNQDLYGSLEWQNALNDVLNEENITVECNKILNAEVIQYIQTFASDPENLKALHLQYLESDRNQTKGIFVDSAGDDQENATAEENPFWDDTPTRRIYRGLRTKIKSYPFVVSVLVLNTFACAGSIIKNDLVITAASCLQLAHNNRFFRENPILVEVRVGSVFFIIGGEAVPVTDIYFHPMYNPQTLRNNLAIMRLRRVLNFRRKNVKKIEIDRSPSALPENTPPITILGWGARSESNKLYFRSRLHVTSLDYYDRTSCGEIYGTKFVTRNNFCAGFISRGEGACNHDVGDPGVLGRYLVGVTSFGSPVCGKPDTPTVFTKLGYYTDWIQEIMDQDIPRYRYSTTTRRPYRDFEKPIILYGNGGEDAPIPLQREGVETEPAQDTATVDSHIQIVLNELKKLGIENSASEDLIRKLTINNEKKEETLPFEDQDPEIPMRTEPIADGAPIHQFIDSAQISDEKNGNPLRDEGGDNEEELSKKLTKDREWSGVDSDETRDQEYRATKIFNFDAKVTMSREERKTEETDEVSVGKVTKLTAVDLSAEKSTTNYVKTHHHHTTSEQISRNPEKNINKSNVKKKHVTKNKKDDTALRKKHRIATAANSHSEVTYAPKHSAKQGVHVALPNILGNIYPIDLADDDNNTLAKYHKITPEEHNIQAQLSEKEDSNKGFDKNDLKEHRESPPHTEEIQDHSQLQAELANELADDIVKREIQKLIQQLELSGELSAQADDSKLTDINALRNDMGTNKTEHPDTLLTFLYLTDGELNNNIQQRAKLDTREENLSIDPEPFKRNTHQRNHLVGKSEIYEIFANVLNTVVNKTLE